MAGRRLRPAANSAMQSPTYEHHCDDCRFVGRLDDFVVYACPQHALNLPTLVLRFADEPADYMSCPIDVASECDVLPFAAAFRLFEATADGKLWRAGRRH